MRDPLHRDPTRDPRSSHSAQRTLPGALGATLLAPALVMAVLYPAAAVAVAALAVAVGLALRPLRRLYRARRRAGRTREICVPKTGVCVEV
jgi:hypothetical protein